MMVNQSGVGMAWMRSALWLAVAGSLVACGGPASDSGVSAELLQKVAQGVARAEGQVKAEELARWIIEGRKDFVLFDIRPAGAFATGHIQGAENLPVTELVAAVKLPALPTDRKIVVYGQRAEETAAAAALLRLAGRDGVLLLGGYDAWSRTVLNPDIPDVPTVGESPAAAEKRAIACYFVGGQGAQAAAPAPAPKPVQAAPPAAAPAAPAAGGLIQREGC